MAAAWLLTLLGVLVAALDEEAVRTSAQRFDFSFESCSRLLQRLNWNQNVSDVEWKATLTIATNCMRHRETLARSADRPAAMTGLHVPTTIVPVEADEVEMPPMYFVLPVWDLVVSNRVRLHGYYDLQELDVLLRMTPKGGAFVDIGANVGAVAVPLAAHVGPRGVVYAFEPFRQVFQYLNANLAVNGLANVHTHWCALSAPDAPPRVHIPAPSLMAGQNAGMYGVFQSDTFQLNERISQERERMEDVVVRTLDSFELPRADVIKIDVEGHAPLVLAGSVETLKRHQPILWFEQGGSVPEVLTRPDVGYRCTLLTDTTEETMLCAPAHRFADVIRELNR